MSKGYGKPKVGGPFTLRDTDGNEFTEKDLQGKYTMVGEHSSIPGNLDGCVLTLRARNV